MPISLTRTLLGLLMFLLVATLTECASLRDVLLIKRSLPESCVQSYPCRISVGGYDAIPNLDNSRKTVLLGDYEEAEKDKARWTCTEYVGCVPTGLPPNACTSGKCYTFKYHHGNTELYMQRLIRTRGSRTKIYPSVVASQRSVQHANEVVMLVKHNAHVGVDVLASAMHPDQILVRDSGSLEAKPISGEFGNEAAVEIIKL